MKYVTQGDYAMCFICFAHSTDWIEYFLSTEIFARILIILFMVLYWIIVSIYALFRVKLRA